MKKKFCTTLLFLFISSRLQYSLMLNLIRWKVIIINGPGIFFAQLNLTGLLQSRQI